MLKAALAPGTRKGAIAKALREALESKWGAGIGGLFDGAGYVCGLFHDRERKPELDQEREEAQRRKVSVDEEGAESNSIGVVLRDKWFLRQYNARGTDTYHRPAKIHAAWGEMSTAERAKICPDAPSKITKAGVAQAIKRARRKTVARKPPKPE